MKLEPSWLQDRIEALKVFECFIDFDPNSRSFYQDLSAHLDSRIESLWMDFFSPFTGYSDELILRNLWALGSGRSESLSILVRIAMRRVVSEEWSDLANRLASKLRSQVPPDSWLLFVAGLQADFSLLVPSSHTDAFKLRYQLALLNKDPRQTATILKLWPNYKHLSRLAYQRELKRSAMGAAAAGSPWKRLTPEEFQSLNVDERFLVCSDSQLAAEFLGEKALASAAAKSTIADRGKLTTQRKVLRGFLGALRVADYSLASDMAKEFGPTEIDEQLIRQFSARAKRNLEAPQLSREWQYAALSPTGIQLAKKLCGQLRILDAIGLDSSKLAEALAKGGIPQSAIPKAIFDKLKREWSAAEILVLCDAGKGHLVSYLSSATAIQYFESLMVAGGYRNSPVIRKALVDSLANEKLATLCREILVKQSTAELKKLLNEGQRRWSSRLERLLFELYGTEFVDGVLDDSRSETLQSLTEHLAKGGKVSDREAFCTRLVSRLAKSFVAQQKDGAYALDGVAKQLVGINASIGAQFVCALPKKSLVDWVVRSLRSLSSTWLTPLLSSRSDHQSVAFEVAAKQLAASSYAREILALVKDYPALVAALNAEVGNRLVLGAGDDDLVVLVLCYRRHSGQLKKLAIERSGETFRVALDKAKIIEGLTPRERGYLYLVSTLGGRWSKVIAAALASMRKESKPGHKLDHLYHRYELPKKSGGMRPIAAPPSWLKALQRAILEKILDPLAVHEASHGFVRGRSIISNAKLHVGSPLVANCDIANCFPSIRWQLVLGALKRDLAHQLDASAVSLLIDLCTFEGGLPIGAPTSPSLLNRVLYQTDVWLTQAAEERGARYSRYADDLTFSGDDKVPELLAIARKVVSRIGLKLDNKKTQIYRNGRRQIVTGLVVNEHPSVPRYIRRRVRAAVHAVENGRSPTWHGGEESLSALVGRTAFVKSVNTEEGGRLLARLRRLSGKTSAKDE